MGPLITRQIDYAAQGDPSLHKALKLGISWACRYAEDEGAKYKISPADFEYTMEKSLPAKRRGVALSQDVKPFQLVAEVPKSSWITTDDIATHFQPLKDLKVWHLRGTCNASWTIFVFSSMSLTCCFPTFSHHCYPRS